MTGSGHDCNVVAEFVEQGTLGIHQVVVELGVFAEELWVKGHDTSHVVNVTVVVGVNVCVDLEDYYIILGYFFFVFYDL